LLKRVQKASSRWGAERRAGREGRRYKTRAACERRAIAHALRGAAAGKAPDWKASRPLRKLAEAKSGIEWDCEIMPNKEPARRRRYKGRGSAWT
jgi:hypothetical protein